MTINEWVEEMRNTEGSILLDVRDTEEYEEGHIEGSINVPVSCMSTWHPAPGSKIYVYCVSGDRALRAVKVLLLLGYEAVNIGGLTEYEGTLVTDH